MRKTLFCLIALLIIAMPVYAQNSQDSQNEQKKYRYISGKESDVAVTTGEYAGFRKIINHEYEGEYELYFKSENGIRQMSSKYVGNHSMQEIYTVTYNGKTFSHDRATWYKVIDNVHSRGEQYVQGIKNMLGMTFYNQYWAYTAGHIGGEKIIDEYISEIYIPRITGKPPVKSFR